MEEFDWQATESAPKNYLMEILSGSLVYHDGSGSLYVPDGVELNNGWGRGRSSHIVGPDLKPLPDRLRIRFFSFMENQFYEGDFELPYEKILNLFQEGYYSPNEEGDVTYSQIVVGVAPGGAVSVWLRGLNRITEVFFGEADKIDVDWKHFSNGSDTPREEYIRLSLEDALDPESLNTLHKKGIPVGLWKSYHQRYNWQPLFTGMSIRHNRIDEITFFNGEQDYIDILPDGGIDKSTLAVPNFLSFVWEYAPGKGRMFEMTFFEEEIFDAFRKLGPDNQPLYLEMLMETVDGERKFSAALRNEKESIKLKRTNLETFSVRDWGPEIVE